MPESYEQRNERFLQMRQFCNLGCCSSCCCRDKRLLIRELSFQPVSIIFAFKRDCKSPPIPPLHSFPVFTVHIFTVSTFSQLWIQMGKLWTARQWSAVSLWRWKVWVPPSSVPHHQVVYSSSLISPNIWNTLGFLQLMSRWSGNGCRGELRSHWRKSIQMLFGMQQIWLSSKAINF